MLPLAAELAATWRVFVPVIPGTGRSDRPSRPATLAGLIREWVTDASGASLSS